MDASANRIHHHDAKPEPERSIGHIVAKWTDGIADRIQGEAEEACDAVENPSPSVNFEAFVNEHILDGLFLSVDEKQIVDATDGAHSAASKHGSS